MTKAGGEIETKRCQTRGEEEVTFKVGGRDVWVDGAEERMWDLIHHACSVFLKYPIHLFAISS